jgi:hypothetical protein
VHAPTYNQKKKWEALEVLKLPMDPKAKMMAKQEACTTSKVNMK